MPVEAGRQVFGPEYVRQSGDAITTQLRSLLSAAWSHQLPVLGVALILPFDALMAHASECFESAPSKVQVSSSFLQAVLNTDSISGSQS